MERDRHGPPPELSEEERRRWWQWRKFVWGPNDIVITKRGERSQDRSEEPHEGREDDTPGGMGER